MVRRAAAAVSLIGLLLGMLVAAPSAGAVTVAWDTMFPSTESPHGGDPYSMTSVGDVSYILFTDFNVCWLARLEVDGSSPWIREVGRARDLTCRAITSDGDALYVEMSAWGPLDDLPNGDKADTYVRKLDLDGTILWTRAYSGTDSQFGWSIAAAGGSVYVTGAIYHPMGVQEAFIRRYDTDGVLQWTRTYDPGDADSVFISVTADATGAYVGWIDFGPGAAILKYLPDGTVAWTTPLSAEQTEILGLARGGGSLYAAGSTGGVFDGKVSLGNADAWVLSLDPATGALGWVRQFGSPGSEYVGGLAVGPQGVYVVGQTGGALPRFENRGGWDAFARAYSFTGKRRWTRQFGTHREDLATAATADAAGVIVVGQTTGNFGDARSNGGWLTFARRWAPA
jgi:hypothetical protein